MFEVGRVYNRRSEIHEPYGGQRQGSISTPRDWPFIFLFTGESGEQYGYRDGWDDNGIFLHTGEGQQGDMEFARGNLAIRDHALESKDLHLFQALGRSQGYRYLGRFACSTWEFREGVDVNGDERRVIVFHLIQPEDDEEASEPTSPAVSQAMRSQLRERAFKAATEVRERTPREAKRRYHERSAAVREYVLARAAGTCESCGQPAPFRRQDGTPYLEPHHTRRLSDGGPDHPRWGRCCLSQLPPRDAPRGKRRRKKQRTATPLRRARGGVITRFLLAAAVN
jgi:5-methylcytosine-specific restriction enzyme A